MAALLLRAGHLARDRQADDQLRPAARRHQPADDQRAWKRRLPRPADRRDSGRRRGRRSDERRRGEPPQLGAPGRRDLPVRRADRHPGGIRPQLRHRRLRLAVRSQRDAEPAGPRGPGITCAVELRPRLYARIGTHGRGLSAGTVERPVPAARRRVDDEVHRAAGDEQPEQLLQRRFRNAGPARDVQRAQPAAAGGGVQAARPVHAAAGSARGQQRLRRTAPGAGRQR